MSERSIAEDFERAGDGIEPIAIALAKFVEGLSPNGGFRKEGPKSVYRPNNFVTFQVQPRKMGLLLTLRGTPAQFRERAMACGLKDEYVKNLHAERSAYSRYAVTSSDQLLPAAQFIKWAADDAKKLK